MRFGSLWGHDRGLDYWTALARGEVSGPEQRAIALLKRVVDPYRFSLYCLLGRLPCMGNVTKTIYLVQRGGSVVELEDGFGIASWCISIGPHSQDVPETDHVVALRAVIEGEELAFMRTGNRGNGARPAREHPYVCSPFEEPFGPKVDYRLDRMIGTDQLLDPRPDERETGMVAPAIGVGEAMGDDLHGEHVEDEPGGFIHHRRREYRRRRPRRVYQRNYPGWFEEVCYDVGADLGQGIAQGAQAGNVGDYRLMA